MEEKGSGARKDDIAPATQVEFAHNGSEHNSSLSPQEDNYKMTKTTFLAVLAFSWSWASVGVMNVTTTTIAHQVASVGDAGELAWISNSSLVVQVALQAIMVGQYFHRYFEVSWANQSFVTGIFW